MKGIIVGGDIGGHARDPPTTIARGKKIRS